MNLTDEESRIMKVSSGGFEQCYNAKAGVDAATMLVVAVHNQRTMRTLLPFRRVL